MEGGIVDLIIAQDNTMRISYSFIVPSEYEDYYGSSTFTYEMVIDAVDDKITFNDFDMLMNLNSAPASPYETKLNLTKIEGNDVDTSLTIDLSTYEMDIIKKMMDIIFLSI